MKRTRSLVFVAAAALLVLALAASADEKTDKKGQSKMVKTASGLQYEDTREGTGPQPKKGQTCSMHYTGWLWENGARGKKFDSSFDRGKPYDFALGRGEVIKGWDEGVATMKVGGQRKLLIPPLLGYGAAGTGRGLIPPNATLLFEVQLIAVR